MTVLQPGPGAALLLAIERIAAARDVREIAELVAVLGRRAIGCDVMRLSLREGVEARAMEAGPASLPREKGASWRAPRGGTEAALELGLADLALRQGQPVVIQDVEASKVVPPGTYDACAVRAMAVAAVPGAGALVAAWPDPVAVSPDAVDVLQLLAGVVSRALEMARLVDAVPHLLWTRHADGSVFRFGHQWSFYQGLEGGEAGGPGDGPDDPSGPPGLGGLEPALHPDDRAPSRAAWEQALVQLAPVELEHRLRLRTGGYRWFSTRAVPVRDAAGQLRQWLGTCTDIDALVQRRLDATRAYDEIRRRLQDEVVDRSRTEARLAKAERIEAVGQLTSGVAHDFNNLLTVIIGNIEFLEATRASVDDRTRGRLVAIREAAERGGDLTHQLLAFARRQRLEPRSTDLNEIVAELRGLLPAAIGGGLRVETVLERTLWPALVDRTQIERMILNLAHNAHDAMDVGGTVTVATRNRRVGPQEAEGAGLPMAGDFVEVSVSDSGRGMTPEILAHAFEPFFTTKAPGKGSGLGLAQVYGFARQSGGTVTLRSTEGEGTCAAILLPRALEAAEAAGFGAASEPFGSGRETRAFPQIPPLPASDVLQVAPPPPAAPARLVRPTGIGPVSRERVVLLVDDDSAVREVTSTIVTEAGYRVVEAMSGSEALDRMQSVGPVDLMVTDYAMPGMNGFELSRAAQARQPGLKVLFVTGYADLTALGEVTETNILLKPFRGGKLLDKIAGALAQ